ncbi:MAG: homocysteine biosynthesis protein, partial [Deltaproteobacteria bacterium]|nr:homocysteine biosynthesis protein [Deltaproteobacteria bacterium]
YTGYGVTLTVGIGVPIPILNEEILQYTMIQDEEILAQVIDYSDAYPQFIPGCLGEVYYKQVLSG